MACFAAAGTGEIAAHMLSDNNADDAAQLPGLLRSVEGQIASLATNSAYDGEPTCEAARARHPNPPPDMVVPPRTSAVINTADLARQSPRDRHVHLIAERGRMAW
ncbi:MAG: hypothetical protein ACRYG8_55405 [Janthinobacterium lividum]